MALIGVFETDLQEYLIESGIKEGLKFAYPSRGRYQAVSEEH